MKKTIMLGALLSIAHWSLACDQCGCGLLLGVQPYDHANNFGLQWHMRYLHGDVMNVPPTSLLKVLKHGGHAAPTSARMPTSSTYTEVYSVLEARGQFWFGERASLTASIPLLNNFAAVDNVREADIYAVGDPILLGRYAILGSLSGPDTTRLRHRLSVGLGVKVPLAKHDVSQYGETLDHDLQPSTGTWDGLASIEYTVRGGRWGTSLSLVGRYNGTAEDGYQLGHSASFTAEAFRIIPIKAMKLLPSLGGYLESALPDVENDIVDRTTGGSTLFSDVGARLWWNGFGLSFTWEHALINDLGALMVPNRERFVAGITYNIEKD
jgi:hypothetical protein